MSRNKVAVVTGGAQGIGRAIVDAFTDRGVSVCMIDKRDNSYFVGDIGDEEVLTAFAEKVLSDHDGIDYLINNACLSCGGLQTCTYADFNYVLRVGVTAPFFLTKCFSDHLRPGASIVNISSTRHIMSQSNTESYTAAKGGISALTHAMAVSLSGRARVNSISPGWIVTDEPTPAGFHADQHPAGRIGTVADIVHAVMFLCDPASGFITGQDLVVDGGMTKMMIYHNDHGWIYTNR